MTVTHHVRDACSEGATGSVAGSARGDGRGLRRRARGPPQGSSGEGSPSLEGDHSCEARSLKQEALAAAKLGHPNIGQVTDFQSRPDEPALIVMEMLQGESLHAVLQRERKLQPRRAVFIAMQILAALSAAHAAGIVHRDIKPANVFLTETLAMADLVKVLDFGIAKTPDLRSSFVTEPGRVLGTLAYMAPEQLRHGGGDHRVDLYAVGVCLFEILSGSRPHHASTLAELAAIFEAPPAALRMFAPELDPSLVDVVERALRMVPEERPPRALDMLSSLAPWGPRNVAVRSANLSHAPATEVFTIGVTDQDSAANLIEVPVHAPPGPLPPPAPQRPRTSRVVAAPSPELSKASLQSLLCSAAALFLCCLPLGVVGVAMGLRARSIAQRVEVPLPLEATFGLVLGVISTLWSLSMLFYYVVLRLR